MLGERGHSNADSACDLFHHLCRHRTAAFNGHPTPPQSVRKPAAQVVTPPLVDLSQQDNGSQEGGCT